MKSLYVPEGTWTVCTEGKKIPKLQVTSQSKVFIEGKLKATEDDRFDGNFECFKMVTAAACVGAAAGSVLAALGGATLGGAVLAAVGGAAKGAAVGAIAGGLLGKIPSLCSFLCKPYDWSEIHSKVFISGKRALLQKAELKCLLGGTVSLKMPNLQEVIDMGLLAGEDVYENSREAMIENNKNMTPEQLERVKSYHRLTEQEISDLGLNEKLFHPDDEDGFYAQLYKKGDTYVLAYRGTLEIPDIKEDGRQGIGISIDQYNKSAKLGEALRDNSNFNKDNLIITGHSLGGGLAAIAGGATGYPTYTYNAAGVHDYTLRKNEVKCSDMNHVQAFNSSDDPLNIVQDKREIILGLLGKIGGLTYLTGGLPRAAGEQMELETNVGLIKGHTAIHIVNRLEKEQAIKGRGNTSVFTQSK